MGSMDCQDIMRLVTDYQEEALQGDARAHFERHAAICPACGTYVAQMLLTTRSCAGLDHPEEVPADVMAGLMEAFRLSRGAEGSSDQDRLAVWRAALLAPDRREVFRSLARICGGERCTCPVDNLGNCEKRISGELGMSVQAVSAHFEALWERQLLKREVGPQEVVCTWSVGFKDALTLVA